MRKLEESVAAEGGSSSNGSGATAANSNAAVSISSDGVTAEDSSEPAAAAAVDSGEAGGSFLLRIPMQDLVGIALEPLLIITVDIDPVHGQVSIAVSCHVGLALCDLAPSAAQLCGWRAVLSL
jgi:hypothetical protein